LKDAVEKYKGNLISMQLDINTENGIPHDRVEVTHPHTLTHNFNPL
jgi:hypothetical protein